MNSCSISMCASDGVLFDYTYGHDNADFTCWWLLNRKQALFKIHFKLVTACLLDQFCICTCVCGKVFNSCLDGGIFHSFSVPSPLFLGDFQMEKLCIYFTPWVACGRFSMGYITLPITIRIRETQLYRSFCPQGHLPLDTNQIVHIGPILPCAW